MSTAVFYCPFSRLSVCPSIRQPNCPPALLNICPSTQLPICRAVRLLVSQSVHLLICLSARLPLCPFYPFTSLLVSPFPRLSFPFTSIMRYTTYLSVCWSLFSPIFVSVYQSVRVTVIFFCPSVFSSLRLCMRLYTSIFRLETGFSRFRVLP